MPVKAYFRVNRKEKKVIIENWQSFEEECLRNLLGIDSFYNFSKKVKKQGYKVEVQSKEKLSTDEIRKRLTRIHAKQDELAQLCMKVMNKAQDLMKANLKVWSTYKYKTIELEKRM